MGTLDPQTVPGIEQAKEVLEERKLQAEAQQDLSEDLSAEALAKAEARKAKQEGKLEAAYSRADDYVSQTQAALKEHRQRQEALRSGETIAVPDVPEQDDERAAVRKQEEDDRHHAAQQGSGGGSSSDYYKQQEAADAPFSNVEITERLQRLRDRYAGLTETKTGTDHSHDEGPDKQREAPGGGHTRSR